MHREGGFADGMKAKDGDKFIFCCDFASAVVAAQSNDRSAFEQLKTWSEDSSLPYRHKAHVALRKVMQSYNPAITGEPVDFPWKEGFDPSRLSIRDYTTLYDKVGIYKASLMKCVWSIAYLPRKEKMQFLVNILKDEKDLGVLEYAGRLFKRESKQDVFNIAYWEHLTWWEEHIGSYNK